MQDYEGNSGGLTMAIVFLLISVACYVVGYRAEGWLDRAVMAVSGLACTVIGIYEAVLVVTKKRGLW